MFDTIADTMNEIICWLYNSVVLTIIPKKSHIWQITITIGCVIFSNVTIFIICSICRVHRICPEDGKTSEGHIHLINADLGK